MKTKKKLAVTVIAIAVLFIIPLSAYAAVDGYNYNKAESFLNKIGIDNSELSRSDTKKVYKDIKSDSFEYETTVDVLNERAQEIGIESASADGREIYDSIVEYYSLHYTAKITSEQIKSIKAGMTYDKIIEYLGPTKDIGSGVHVLLYAVDGDKVFYLSYADGKDVCNQSGEQLLKTLIDAKQDNTAKNTFNATLIQRMDNSILVSCPTYEKFDIINLRITQDTVIVFKDGKKAIIDDIKDKLTITISDVIAESYPPLGTALKIVINN
ncbi:MAG: hypothetical protein GYA50_11015 [Eubacteriaceae bacterium]|nr:hypothetical protein [Eubacteriaceae bacterium]